MSNIIRLFPDVMAPYHIEEPPLSEAEMEVKEFREKIVRPALVVTDLWNQRAENLIVGTALNESDLRVVTQNGGGPGLSFMQIEPASYLDIQEYLKRKPKLRAAILAACYMELFPPAEALCWHLRLSVLVARLIYFRRPEELPRETDALGMYNYYKKFYNGGDLGKASQEVALPHFKIACST